MLNTIDDNTILFCSIYQRQTSDTYVLFCKWRKNSFFSGFKVYLVGL